MVIPYYKLKNQILTIPSKIKGFVYKNYEFDDNCPENSEKFIMENFIENRIKVIFNQKNLGVGVADKNKEDLKLPKPISNKIK